MSDELEQALDALATTVRRDIARQRVARARYLASLPSPLSIPPIKAAPTDYLTAPITLTETKSDVEAGTVEGYVAVFGNLDLVGDIIEPGAFKQTLLDAQATAARYKVQSLWPFLWQHDMNEPIGGIYAAREDGHGLLIKVRLATSIEKGRQALFGFREGYLCFSIGYKPVRYEYKGTTRHLRTIKLIEGSCTPRPANPEARVVRVYE